ncbi:PREDICTED: granzyme E-like [Buceros rhinoceros silvestris]|uniref:granzyme E-like n=1 Tax=Buceros rhinoceros silvestris TaxID=175836 RepID=UPI0005285F22|nr:PREDICTED: granzyme E-like [Buceros rhinoceros silvestris]
MKHLQKLLLLVLLVTCLPAKAHYPWNRMERGAKTRSTPYVAYLQGKNTHVCGGFLVAPNWVMTAAQCAAHKPLTVILGARTIQRKEDSWQTFEVQEYHCHPDFKIPRDGNDILLLKLKGNATSNSYVQTIAFEKSKVPDGTVCSIVGWGNKTPTATLREATVTIVKQRECIRQNPFLADNLICGHSGSAGVPEKSDAGDPLVCNNKAYGIFSYKHNKWPGFYTRIAPYLPWINKVMKAE